MHDVREWCANAPLGPRRYARPSIQDTVGEKSRLRSKSSEAGSELASPQRDSGTNVSPVGPSGYREREIRAIPTLPPCGLKFVGKSLKSDDLNGTLG